LTNLVLLTNELVPVYKNSQEKRLVNARELHEWLESGQDFSDWIKGRIEQYGFIENKDFSIILGKSTGGRPSKEYIITLDMAKELSMVERTEKGKEARQYFIKCEEKLQELTRPSCIEDVLIQSLQEMKDMRLQIVQTKQQTAAVKEEVQAIRDVVEIRPSANWRNETNTLVKKICFQLKDYQKPKEELYKAVQERGACDLKRRLENMRARFLLNGGSRSKADQLNYLDVIAEDKKLIEIYTAIVKELAIKYKVA
jgi:anti-repressor protein